MRIICLLITTLFSIGCLRMPFANMTDTYIEVNKPGQILGLLEIEAIKIDTTFGYPSEELAIISYTIVERKSKQKVDNNAMFKIYFDKKHKKYQWKVRKNPSLSDYYYTDTLTLKHSTWYRLSIEKYAYDVYFFLNKENGTYLRKLKPKVGGW